MKKLLFIGLLAFIIAAVWLTPLAYVLPHIQKTAPQIKAFEPNGTIWKGNVNHLSVNGHYLGKASWKINIIDSLKSLALKSKFTIKSDDINAYGIAGINQNKALLINNTRFDINTNQINSLQKIATLSGSINGFIKQATLKQQEVPIIEGNVNWQNGALSKPIQLSKGDYRAVIKPDNGNLHIKLSSKEAPIELNGDIQLQNNWTYTTNVSTKSENPGLMGMMKFAGQAQANGSILIKQQGSLKPILGIK